MKVKADTKGLKELQKKIQQFENADYDRLAERCANQLAARMQTECVHQTETRTKTRTGHLKGSWKAIKAVKRGGTWQSVVYNPVKYAPYVEYGHRTRGGRGWVNGRFMMRHSADEIERNATKIIEKEVNKELAKVFS